MSSLRLPITSLCALALAACGAEPSHLEAPGDISHPDVLARGDALPTAADVRVMTGSDTLAANKRAVIAAAKSLGASDDQVDVVLAVGMAETTQMNACDRDASKDAMGGAKNFSAFNLNGDMLSRLGFVDGQGPDLNDQKNIGQAVGYLLKAVNTMTLDGFLCFHRGGDTAFRDRCSYGAQTYVTAIKLVTDYLKAHPEERTSSNRIGMYIQHV